MKDQEFPNLLESSSIIHITPIKTSATTADIVEKALTILTVIEKHLSRKPPCKHCAAMLKQTHLGVDVGL